MASYGAVGDDILRELIKLRAPIEIDGDALPPCRLFVTSLRNRVSIGAQS